MKTKKCGKCGIEKDFDCFYKYSKSKDRHQSRCKSCCVEYNAEYYHNNKEKIKEKFAEYRVEYYQNNKAKIAKKDAEYRKNNKEKIAKKDAEYRSKRKAKQPACVYQILNKVNGKIYIGETLRGELRWKGHLKTLRGNRHKNPKLQADFNKFGEEAFEWSIIKEVDKDKETLVLEEAKTMDSFLKEGKELYNKQLKISKEE